MSYKELSPGTYHRLVPTDPVQNLQFRLKLWRECKKSARARKLVTRACRDDIIFFVNTFGWQTNPENLNAEDGPFICFPFQSDALLFTIEKTIIDRRMALWEKSRKQGGTMLALFLEVWLTLFHKRKRVLVMSHNERAVEQSGDEDTLFGKVDFILNHLPSWMRDGVPRNKGVYKFHDTKSQIVGATTTVRTGVGGRTTMNLLDEVSKYNNAEAILSQLKDTGPCLLIGTHYGVGGTWHDLCERPDVAKVVMHWSLNPMYNKGLYRSDPSLHPTQRAVNPNDPPPPDYPCVCDGSPFGGPYPGLRSPYYDRIAADRTAREMAIHWDIDPTGAARHFFDPKVIRTYISRYCREPDWEGEIRFNPGGNPEGLTKVDSGPIRIWGKFAAGYDVTKKWFNPSIYKVGCDVATGTGATPSCLSAMDAMTGRKILEYQWAYIEPAQFAALSVAMCKMLVDPVGNPAQLVWDASGPTGSKFGETVVTLGFRNIWYWRDEFTLKPKVSDSPGWFANNNSKMALLADYELAVRKGLVTNPSENALKECLAFEYSKTGGIEHGKATRSEDPTAGRMNHADMAIADALAWKLCKSVGADKPSEERAEAEGHQPWTIGWIHEQTLIEGTDDPYRE